MGWGRGSKGGCVVCVCVLDTVLKPAHAYQLGECVSICQCQCERLCLCVGVTVREWESVGGSVCVCVCIGHCTETSARLSIR